MKKLYVVKSVCSVLMAGAMICAAVLAGCAPPGEISEPTFNEEHTGEIRYYETPGENVVRSDDTGLTFANNEILLTASDSASYSDIRSLAAEYGAEIKGYIEVVGDYQLVLSEKKTEKELNEIIDELRKSELVEDASLNVMTGSGLNAFTPNDERWKNEWDDENKPDGENWGLEAIRCPTAWESFNSMTTNAVNVGVLDAAFFSEHEDLRFNGLYVNPANDYFKSKSKDKNGGSESPYDRAYSGICHGTHVAGTIGAHHNNGVGITGVYPLSQNHMYGASVFGLDEDNATSLQSAAEQKCLMAELLVRNCRVINYSMGFGDEGIIYAAMQNNESALNVIHTCSGIMSGFLSKMRTKGYDFVIVTAAGNDSAYGYESVEVSDEHPYGYKKISGSTDMECLYNNVFSNIDNEDLKNRIIVVGATELVKNKNVGFFRWKDVYQRAGFSNEGERLDVMAPGKGITSTGLTESAESDYLTGWQGTSMASPHVAGVAAMVWSVNNSFTGAEVKQIICDSATVDIEDSRAKMINAAEAVRRAGEKSNQSVSSNVENNGVLIAGGYIKEDGEQKFLGGCGVKVYKAGTTELVESGTTGDDGSIEMNLSVGKYDVVCTHDGYTDGKRENVEIKYANVTYADVELKPVVTSFSTPDEMTLTVGHLALIEPEIEPSGSGSYSIKWSSSDESVVTVNPTGEYGTLRALKKGTATITAELESGGKTFTATTSVRVASQGRDTVLVLDMSGSMNGTPLTELKEAAKKFCDDLLLDEFNNRVAIVRYDDTIDYHDFSGNTEELKSYISGVYSGGATNMSGALDKAEELLDNGGEEDHIKNIVVMADGLPNRGTKSNSGSAGISGSSSSVAFANGVVDTAQRIMNKYNMYSLGFFHSVSGTEYNNCVQLMGKLTNMPDGYHEVKNAEDLQFEFGDIATDISDGSKIIINIACPVDVSVSYDGETLSSAEDDYNDKTSFGKLEVLGSKKDVKVLALDSDKKYDVDIKGTGEGTMDYLVNYMNSSDEVEDYRNFSSIPISDSTKISTATDNSSKVKLDVDVDGDGNVDIVYEADSKSSAEITVNNIETTAATEAPSTAAPTVQPTQPQPQNTGGPPVMMIVVIAIGVLIILGLIIILAAAASARNKSADSYEIPVIRPEPPEIKPAQQPNQPVNQPVNRPVNRPAEKPANQFAQSDIENADAAIEVLSGSMKGMRVPINDGETIVLGKSAQSCQLVFDNSYESVSRVHCIVSFDRARRAFRVTDMSTNGTYQSGHIRLVKNQKTTITSGTLLSLCDDKCIVRLVILNS